MRKSTRLLAGGVALLLCAGVVYTAERGVGRTGKADRVRRDANAVVGGVSSRPVHPGQTVEVTRDDVIDFMNAFGREPGAATTNKAGNLLVRATELMAKGAQEPAFALATRVSEMDLPDTDSGNQVLADANFLMADYYSAQAPASLKAAGHLEFGARYLDPAEDAEMIGAAYEQAADIYRSLGRTQDANRLERLAQGDSSAQSFGFAGGSGSATTLDPGNPGHGVGCDTATAITVGDTVPTTVGLGEHVWTSFTLADSRTVQLETTNCPAGDCDSNITLYGGCDPLDNAANQIAFDEDGGDGFLSLLESPCLGAGTYYVEVGGWLDASGFEGDLVTTDLGTCFIPVPDEFEPDNEVGGSGVALSTIGCDTLMMEDEENEDEEDESDSESENSSGSSGGGGSNKVDICHIPPGNPGNAHTISVSQNAVSAHLGHGDTLGPCGTSCQLLQSQCRTITAGDIDFVTFNVGDEARRVRISTSSSADCGGSGDPLDSDTIIAVTDALGTIFSVNDDDPAGGTFGSAIEFCAPPNNDFNVAVLGFDPTDNFAYQLTVDATVPCTLETEANGSCEIADDLGTINVGETITTGAFHSPFLDPFTGGVTADQDWYAVTLATDCDILFLTDATDTQRTDTELEILVNGSFPAGGCDSLLSIGFSDDLSGTVWTSGLAGVIPAGTYYARVSESAAFGPGLPFPYDLIVDCAAPPIPEVEPNDVKGSGMPIALGDTIAGSVDGVGDLVDFFEFSLLEDTQVVCETAASDSVLELFDVPCNQLCCDDDSGPGFASVMSICLPPGAYTVGIQGFGGGGGANPYTLSCNSAGPCSANPDPTMNACTDDGDPFAQCPFGI